MPCERFRESCETTSCISSLREWGGLERGGVRESGGGVRACRVRESGGVRESRGGGWGIHYTRGRRIVIGQQIIITWRGQS